MQTAYRHTKRAPQRQARKLYLSVQNNSKLSRQSQKFWLDRIPGWAQIMLLVMLLAGACVNHP